MFSHEADEVSEIYSEEYDEYVDFCRKVGAKPWTPNSDFFTHWKKLKKLGKF